MAFGVVPCNRQDGHGKQITFDSEELVRRILGVNDRNIPYIEALLGCELFVRSNDVICLSDDRSFRIAFSCSSDGSDGSLNIRCS